MLLGAKRKAAGQFAVAGSMPLFVIAAALARSDDPAVASLFCADEVSFNVRLRQDAQAAHGPLLAATEDAGSGLAEGRLHGSLRTISSSR
jgi:hypothetical protein